MQYFDSIFRSPGFGFPKVLWTGRAYLTDGGRTYATATQEDVVPIAQAIYDDKPLYRGTPMTWSGTHEVHGTRSLVCLDFEGHEDLKGIVHYLELARQAMPTLRLGYYPFMTFTSPKSTLARWDGNRDVFVTPNKWMKSWMASSKSYVRPIVKLCDYLAPDFYLLGNDCFERDLKYMLAVCKHLAAYDKPIYPFIWGVWHEAWNPPIWRSDPERRWVKGDPDIEKYYRRPNRQQYDVFLDTLEECADGAIIWGPLDDNEDLVEAIDARAQ